MILPIFWVIYEKFQGREKEYILKVLVVSEYEISTNGKEQQEGTLSFPNSFFFN